MLAPILSIQSHVVYGHVGNSAAAFPLQRLGREVWPLMSVQFSSHTGYSGRRGRAVDAGGARRAGWGGGGAGVPRRVPALPLATIATPNAFELEWLTGAPVKDRS